MPPISILIADDHEIVRYGISTYLSTCKDIEIKGEAATGDECITLFKQHKPDLCLLDINMPGKDGIETAKAIRALDLDTKILFLSMHDEKDILRNALKVGVNGYLLKSTAKTDLLDGIRLIMKGQQVFSDSISKMITESFLENKVNDKLRMPPPITKREQEILELIVEGKTSKEIAKSLYISPRTVDTHRANLMQKLKLNNIADLVRYAIKENIVPA